MADPVYIFFHIPKTGGQSFRDCFNQCLQRHEEFVHLGPNGIKDAQQRGLLPFEQRPVAERLKARVILGHLVSQRTRELVPGREPRFVTFLREPAERWLSAYNFTIGVILPKKGLPPVPFDEWYATARRKNMVWWLAARFLQEAVAGEVTTAHLAKVQRALEQFWFVGCTDTMSAEAPVLLRAMGVNGQFSHTNITGVRFPKTLEMTEPFRAQIQADQALEYELYHHWRARRAACLARLDA